MNFNLWMKKIIALSCFSGVLLCVVVLGIGNVSCNKPTDCKVQVTIVDSVNQPVNLAVVKLYSSNPPGQVDGIENTNIYGIASFDFKLPAIFDIQAYAIIADSKGNVDTILGNGVVQLQVGQTVYATVTAKTVHGFQFP
jgi:hypothetical protein